MARVSFDSGDYQPPDWIDFGGGGETGGKAPAQNPSTTTPSTIERPIAGVPSQPYNTGAGWGDPLNPAQPQDPYYSLFQALNPTAATAPPVGPQMSSGTSSGGTANSVSDLVNSWMTGNNPWGHQDAQYWVDKINAGGGLANADYWHGRFLENPNNNPHTGEQFGGPPTNAPGSYLGPNPGGYDDPSSVLFLNEVMDYLNRLKSQQNQQNPYEALLQLYGLNQVNNLSGAPYTSGQDAALRARYLEPLTQARDQALQMNKERIGARGMLPSSGMLDVLNRGTQQGYEKAVGAAANDTAIQAINEQQRRQMEQLAILTQLLGVSQQSQDRSNALGQSVVNTAQVFPNFDRQRMMDLLAASGEGASSPSSVLSGLTGLGNLNLNASNSAYGQSQNNAAAWGQILGYLFGHMNG
jgi:hypothetical protein